VYRALAFLLEQGLVHRLETVHAYVSCAHPGEPHFGQFLICTACGDVTELEDTQIARSLRRAESATGFHTARRVIEISGVCARCGDAGTAGPPAGSSAT
jgi:Fur family zinc uptake transcriptional regulator